MNQRGFTLLEGLLALAILGIALAGILPAFFGYMHVTTRNEMRTGAVAAAQRQMETLRFFDPTAMPTSGATGPDYIHIEDLCYAHLLSMGLKESNRYNLGNGEGFSVYEIIDRHEKSRDIPFRSQTNPDARAILPRWWAHPKRSRRNWAGNPNGRTYGKS